LGDALAFWLREPGRSAWIADVLAEATP